MASSFKTTHLNLNQWDEDDGIQMVDFNADNAKLDAAYHQLSAAMDAAPLARLKAITTTEAQQSVSIDLTDIDIEDYALLYLLFPAGVSRIQVNGLTENGEYAGYSSSSSTWSSSKYIEPSGGWMILDLQSDPMYLLTALRAYRVTNLAGSELEYIQFTHSTGSYPAGSKFAIIGLKL